MSLSTNKLKRRIKLMKTTVISEKYLWLKIKRAKKKGLAGNTYKRIENMREMI